MQWIYSLVNESDADKAARRGVVSDVDVLMSGMDAGAEGGRLFLKELKPARLLRAALMCVACPLLVTWLVTLLLRGSSQSVPEMRPSTPMRSGRHHAHERHVGPRTHVHVRTTSRDSGDVQPNVPMAVSHARRLTARAPYAEAAW